MLKIQPPETAYSSLIDIGKYNLLWGVNMLLFPIFVTLFFIHLWFHDPAWQSSLFALLFSAFNIFYLFKNRTYKLIGVLSIVIGIVIFQFSMFGVADSRMIPNVMWGILVSFFAFFMAGWLTGTTVLMINLSGLLIHAQQTFQRSVNSVGTIPVQEVDYKMVINVYYVAFALSFIIFKILDNTRKTNRLYEKEIKRNEVLLKEIHHRVKNNLQIMSSLLKLQAAESGNEKVAAYFDDAINRIRSMALIHEQMYQNDDLSKINIKTYLESLFNDITESIRVNNQLKLDIDSQISEINVTNIVPLSLIFNELITNSIKHGFKSKMSGEIRVSIDVQGEKMIFHYEDNGAWITPVKPNSFGLELLEILTEQLEGTVERTVSNGTHYQFLFPTEQISPGM